jgi:hypothetical protein
MATSWAWLLALPPVARGQAAAGDDTGLGTTVGVVVGEGLGRAVAVAEAEAVAVGETEREADGLAGAVDAGRPSG